jgi:capsular exopolysaccharide synthesis family protein
MNYFTHDEDELARAGKRQDDPDSSAGSDGYKVTPNLPAIPHGIVYTHTRVVDVPRETMRMHRVVGGYNPSFMTDAYKILSTQVSHKLREGQWRTLGVTSPGRREGKTLTAINLAISLAAEFDQTALLVDADLRRPSVMGYFGLAPEPGLSEYLMWNTPIEDVLINPGVPGFVLLPGGKPLVNSAEALGWHKMTDLVRELKERYPSRVVLFDLPPLLHTADVLAFAPAIDAVLLVVEEGQTTHADVKRAAELLTRTHLIGTVLNKSKALKAPEERPRLSILRRHRD